LLCTPPHLYPLPAPSPPRSTLFPYTTLFRSANRAVPERLASVREAIADLPVPSWVLPDVPLLSAPSIRQLMHAVDGRLLGGDEELLDREAEDVIVGGMTMDHIIDRLTDGAVVIVPGDRSEAVLAVVAAHAARSEER